MIRPKPLPIPPFVLCLAMLLPVAGGCEQEQGESCQTDRDCASGLICRRATSAERGSCKRPGDDEEDAGSDEMDGSAGSQPMQDDAGSEASDAGGDPDSGTDDSDGG